MKGKKGGHFCNETLFLFNEISLLQCSLYNFLLVCPFFNGPYVKTTLLKVKKKKKTL